MTRDFRRVVAVGFISGVLGALALPGIAHALDEMGLREPLRLLQSMTGTSATFSGAVSATGNLTGLARICSDGACTTNYLVNDTFGTLNVVGSFSGSSNWSTAGDMSIDGYSIPKTGVKNTGTAAACSSNTGAVCINDAGGLAIADGSGATVATISAAGKATVATLAVTTDLFTGTLDVTGGATHAVRAGAKCFCWDGTLGTALTCTVSLTTVTIAGGANGDAYHALCPTTS